MSNSTRVWERLYLGSLVDAEKIARSNPFDITTVVSLCSQQVFTRGNGIHYIRIPVTDARPIAATKFDVIMACIGEEIQKGAVLLHCGAGVSRSPIFAAAWMHRCGYRNFDLALKEIAELRPGIDPCVELCASVKEHLQ
jgi:protein-tyrosine phosphatase